MQPSLILRCVTASWMAVAANALVGFLLTPYILHRLGSEAFGIWVLIVALTGYSGYLDLGIRSSVVRFVARYTALESRERVAGVVGAAFWFHLGTCALMIAAAFLLAPHLPAFFSLGGESAADFRALFLLAGVAQGLTFPLSVFGGALEAAGRFDQVHGVQTGTLVLRVALVIFVVESGGGLFEVGAVMLVCNLLAHLLRLPLAFRANPGLSLHPRWLRKDVFAEMFRFGVVALSYGGAESFRHFLYPLALAKFASMGAVTLFALPMKLLSFPLLGIGTMTEFVNPLSSRLDARDEQDRLRRLLLLSVQASSLLFVPLAAVLLVWGREFLLLWVGPAYESGYAILALLTLGLGAHTVQCSAFSMLFGIGRHKGLVWFRWGEGVAIAVLGIALLRLMGVWGFAVGMALSLAVSNLLFVPRHLCRIVGLPLAEYQREGFLKPCALALPAAAALLALRALVPQPSWVEFFAVSAAGGLVYALTLLAVTTWRSRPWCARLSPPVLEMLIEKFWRWRREAKGPALAGAISVGEGNR